jgi:hypothetical protein
MSTAMLLIAASLTFQQTPTPAEPKVLRGEVVDKFDSERILLSFGSDQGVRKGLRGTLVRINAARYPGLKLPGRPDASEVPVAIDPTPFATQWVIEFVDVAAKHSVAKRVVDERMMPWDFRFPDHDPIAWFRELPWEARARYERELKELSELSARRREQMELLPKFMFGGAIIDLTRPTDRVPGK